MGIDVNIGRLLISASQKQISFEKMLTLGRQELFITPKKIFNTLKEYGISDICYNKYFQRADDFKYADSFFRCIGAKQVDSIDYSNFEGARFVHDMNQPIPDEFHQKYNVVFDGGTLEHIFNFPVAIKNCMEMIKKGGHIILYTPANNQCGHGFYQFSPELFYRVFSNNNGYQIVNMFIFEAKPWKQYWYEVMDPAEVLDRVDIFSSWPLFMFIIAKRNSINPIFEKIPQQSDYSYVWDYNNNAVCNFFATDLFFRILFFRYCPNEFTIP